MQEEQNKNRLKRKKTHPASKKDDIPGEKKARLDDFSATVFKHLIKEPETVNTGFEQFLEASKQWTKGGGVDIVQMYCKASPECIEIFQTLEGGNLKIIQKSLALKCLEQILIRIADDLGNLYTTGLGIVKRLLGSHVQTIFRSLDMKNKSNHIKTSLKLLVAMVMLGSQSAKLMLNNVNLAHSSVLPLLNRRDVKDDEDVRMCFIHLIVACLLTQDNDVIRKLAQTKGVIEGLCQGLQYDSIDTLRLVITTLLEKVILNTGLSKTNKVQMFSLKALKGLTHLYNWQGSSHWKESLKQKEADGAGGIKANYRSSEEKLTAAELGHQLLTELCTSFKHGIIFHDNSHGLSGRNQNHLMTGFLSSFTGILSDDLIQKLVINILTACPDQLQHFLPRISHLLVPRESSNWRDLMKFLSKLYESVGKSVFVLKTKEKLGVAKVVDVLMMYTLPPMHVLKPILTGVKMNSLAVNYITLIFIRHVAETANRVLNMVNAWTNFTDPEKQEICHTYETLIHKNLPDVTAVFTCWDKATASTQKSNLEDIAKLKDQCGVTLPDVITEVVQILCLYQQLQPSLLAEHPLILAKLIDGIMGKESTADQGETNEMLKVYLLKLLAATETKRLPWEQKNAQGRSLLYQLLHMMRQLSSSPDIANVCLQLVCKLLYGTGAFDAQYDDLLVWIEVCQQSDPAVLEFVAKVMMTYIRNPYPYMDRFHDLNSQPAHFMETEKKQEDTHMSIEDIIALNVSLEETDYVKPSIKKNRYPFCPMLIVGLDLLEKESAVSEVLQVYMSRVALRVFHRQVGPHTLCNLLSKYKETLLLPQLFKYILTWTETGGSGCNPKNPTVRLEEFLSANSELISPDTDPISHIQQDLLHLTYLIQTQNKDLDKSCTKVLKKLKKSIVANVNEMCTTEKMDTSNSFKAFDMQLDIEQVGSQKSLYTAARLVLDHPSMKQFFLLENETSGNQSFTSIVTALVTEILELIFEQNINLGDMLDVYYKRISYVLQSMIKGESFNQHLVWKILNMTVTKLTMSQCNEVLDLALIAAADDDDHDLLTQLLVSLIDILINSKLKVVKLSNDGLHRLLTNFTDSEGLNEKVYKFVKRFPLLSAQCSVVTFKALVQTSQENGLVQMLMENNVTLASHFAEIIHSKDIEWRSPDKLLIVITYLKVNIMEPPADDTQWKESTARIVKIFKSELLSLCEGKMTSEHLLDLVTLLIHHDLLEDKLVAKMKKKLSAALENADSLSPQHVDLLSTLYKADKHQILLMCTKCLLAAYGRMDTESGREGSEDLQNKLLGVLAGSTEEELKTLLDCSELTSYWPVVIESTIKYAFTKMSALKFVTLVLTVSCRQDDLDLGVNLEDTFKVLTGHSSYTPVMYGESGQDCKDTLVELLLVLIQHCPAVCHTDHIPVFLAAYNASLSLTDQKLLRLIHVYEGNGISLVDSRPMFWGEKAVELQGVWEVRGASLNRDTLSQIMNNIDTGVMKRSTLLFPLRRKLQEVELHSAEEYKSESGCYDPCFFLPLVSHLLEPECVVDCRKFIQTGFFGYAISALSSHDEDMRTVAKNILKKFQGHMEVTRMPEREQMQYMLHVVLNSIPKEKNKLTSIITQFLVRTARLMLKPDDHMYPVMNQFLLLKPAIDTSSVPDFFRLFNTSAIQYQAERSWILTLLKDGLRETADYWIYEKKFAFKLLQAFYHSKLSDGESQSQVLEIMISACKVRRIAVGFCKNHGLLAWISATVNQLSPDKVHQCTQVCSLLSTVWASVVEESQVDTKSDQISFSLQMLACMKCLISLLRKVPDSVKVQFLKTLSSVLSSLSCMKMRGQQVQSLTHAELLLLLLLCQPRWAQVKNLNQSLMSVSHSVGLDMTALGGFSCESDKNEGKEGHMQTENTEDESNDTVNDTAKDLNPLIVNEIVKIISLWRPTDNSLEVDSAVEVLVIHWILEQVCVTSSSEVICLMIELIHRFTHSDTEDSVRNALAYICKDETVMSREMVTDILNTYHILAERWYKCADCRNEKNLEQKWKGALIMLNEVVSDIYSQRYSMADGKLATVLEQRANMLKVCQDSQAARSVILQQMFVKEF